LLRHATSEELRPSKKILQGKDIAREKSILELNAMAKKKRVNPIFKRCRRDQ